MIPSPVKASQLTALPVDVSITNVEIADDILWRLGMIIFEKMGLGPLELARPPRRHRIGRCRTKETRYKFLGAPLAPVTAGRPVDQRSAARAVI